VIAQRTDSHLATASAKRVERWRRIALQASEQSRRTAPPEIADPIKLQDVTNQSGSCVRIVLAESEQQTFLREVVVRSAEGISLAVGPEGGWTEDELQLFRNAGWVAASLGTTILRAETAAIAATAIVVSELG
jgi:16S rRNA (uracil1498-N3)-methyltransferase